MSAEGIDYTVHRIGEDNRNASIRGWFEVAARLGGHADFAICETEEEARSKARDRLLYRIAMTK